MFLSWQWLEAGWVSCRSTVCACPSVCLSMAILRILSVYFKKHTEKISVVEPSWDNLACPAEMSKGLSKAWWYPNRETQHRRRKWIKEGKQEESTKEDIRQRHIRVQSLTHCTFLAKKWELKMPLQWSVMSCTNLQNPALTSAQLRTVPKQYTF